MRVLLINSVYGIRSTGRIVKDLHDVLLEKNNESFVAYGRSKGDSDKNHIFIGGGFNLFYHYLMTRIFDIHGFASRMATAVFIKAIERIDPDIVHIHNLHGYFINVDILFEYFKKKNFKIVWTMHDCWPFTGHCSFFEQVGCKKWETLCEKCPQKDKYPQSWFFDNSKNNFIRKKKCFMGIDNLVIVTPSIWLKNLAKESFLKNYTFKVINNGIDSGIFKKTDSNFREDFNIGNKSLILGVAAYWSQRKGYKHFLELAERIKDDCVIVLVGVNKKQIKSLPDNIIGIPKTNNTVSLAKIYSTADVFVNPTYADIYPTTNIEAIACHTPVITFDSGGSKETITESTGIVLKEKSTEALLSAIMNVLDNPRKFIFDDLDYLDKSEMYKKYVSLYTDLISGKY